MNTQRPIDSTINALSSHTITHTHEDIHYISNRKNPKLKGLKNISNPQIFLQTLYSIFSLAFKIALSNPEDNNFSVCFA